MNPGVIAHVQRRRGGATLGGSLAPSTDEIIGPDLCGSPLSVFSGLDPPPRLGAPRVPFFPTTRRVCFSLADPDGDEGEVECCGSKYVALYALPAASG